MPIADAHAKTFKGDSVELDAIPAARLPPSVARCIERHIDQRQLAILRQAVASEREMLLRWASD